MDSSGHGTYKGSNGHYANIVSAPNFLLLPNFGAADIEVNWTVMENPTTIHFAQFHMNLDRTEILLYNKTHFT